MNVSWKYDVLFSFNVSFEADLRANDFRITPSHNCRTQLKRHNLIFKSVENGGLIITEKRILADTSTVPMWRIKKPIAFTFILQLNNSALLSSLVPFDSVLPDFYGRRRHLFFDNLNSALLPDQDLVDVDVNLKSLEIAAAGTVSEQDLASLVSNDFVYRRENDVSQIRLRPLRPNGGGTLEFNLTDLQPQVKIDLEQSAYHFEQNGASSTSEVLYAGSELLATSTFGIIQIYKDDSIDYNTAIRYDIKFEES